MQIGRFQERPRLRSTLRPRSLTTAASRAPLLCLGLWVGCLTQSVSAEEIDRVVELLAIAKGSTVADVGAGDGTWATRLADVVGSGGRVLATEVTRKNVEEIERRAKREKLDHLQAVLGNQDELGLPADCCDAVLVRMVYHHFQRPEVMRAGLQRAMRPGALILLIDTEPQTSWGDVDGEIDRGGHGVPIDDLLREMTSDGFELVERMDEWSGPTGNPYALLFRWPGTASGTGDR